MSKISFTHRSLSVGGHVLPFFCPSWAQSVGLLSVTTLIEVLQGLFQVVEPVLSGQADQPLVELVLLEEYQDPKKQATAHVNEVEQYFWKLKARMSTVSTPTPLYAQAAERLGYDPDPDRAAEISLSTQALNPTRPVPFVPKLHQTIGAA
jgi:hypothetical protein